MAGWGPALMAGLDRRPARRRAGSRRRASCPTCGRPARRTSTTSASRWPTSWPRPSSPTTPTTRWSAPSATRGRPTTSPASPSASASRSPTPTARPRAGPRCSARPTRRRARWAGRPRAPSCSIRPPARSARRPASTSTGRLLNAEEAIGELVSKAGGAGFEGYWRNDEAERPGCARAGTGPATWPTATRPASSTSPAATTTGSASTARTSPRPRSSGSCSATPTSCWPRSTPCPTRSSATRSWRPCSCGPALDALDADRAGRFLAAQGDLGTKWAPRFVRMSAALPTTATNKVLKRSLRAERWNCAEPVLWQPEKGGPYRLLRRRGAADLEAAVGDRPI